MYIGAKLSSSLLLPLTLSLFNGAMGAESTPNPPLRIAFTVSEGAFVHQERRSVVAVISEGKLLQEVGTDFTQPLLVNVPGSEPLNLCIVPCIGEVTNGIAGCFKVDPSVNPTTVAVNVRAAVPITVRLKNPDGKVLTGSRVTVYDTTNQKYGYANLSYVGSSKEDGSFSFNGFAGESYELKASMYQGGQNIALKFPAIAVTDVPIKMDIVYGLAPLVSFGFISTTDGKELPLSGVASVGIVQDNFPALQPIPIEKDGVAHFSLGSDHTNAATAKTLKLFIKGYELDPNVVTVSDNLAKTVKIACMKKVELRPSDRPMMQEFSLNVVDGNDDPMTTGTAFYLKPMESGSGYTRLDSFMIPFRDKKYVGKTGDKPFIGYVAYAAKYFDLDAVYAVKSTFAPGVTLQMQINAAPHIASIHFTDAECHRR